MINKAICALRKAFRWLFWLPPEDKDSMDSPWIVHGIGERRNSMITQTKPRFVLRELRYLAAAWYSLQSMTTGRPVELRRRGRPRLRTAQCWPSLQR